MLHWEENISGYYTTTLMRAETTCWNATARAAAYKSLNSLFWHTSLKFKCQDASCITHNTHSAWTQVGGKYRGERCPFCSRCRELFLTAGKHQTNCQGGHANQQNTLTNYLLSHTSRLWNRDASHMLSGSHCNHRVAVWSTQPASFCFTMTG